MIEINEIEGYVLYSAKFNEYLAKADCGYTTDELNYIAMWKTKEKAEEYRMEYLDYPEHFKISKIKIRIEVEDI